MQPPKWPKLPHTNPTDLQEHAASLADAFKAVQDFLQAGVSDVAPTLPKGIEHKIKEGIARGLVEVESRDYSTTCISVDDRDLISNAIFEEINVKTAAAFHNRVPQYLFKILQDSYNDLCVKLVSQQNAAPSASEYGNMPQTPPESPEEETDSAFSFQYGSDTSALIHCDWVKDLARLDVREGKLKAQLQEVKRERKTGNQRLEKKARTIENEIYQVGLERKAAATRESEAWRAMEVKRSEQDRKGDYGTNAVGYNVCESADLWHAKQQLNSRFAMLNIGIQAVVNRLFNMPKSVLTRKVIEAVRQSQPVGNKMFPSITHFLDTELLDDGNLLLWAESTDEADWRNYRKDAFDCLSDMPSWDKAIFASFASHLTDTHKTYSVEVKDIAAEVIDLSDRKQKAAVITRLVKDNLKAVPSLHIDIVKDIRFSRRTTNDNTQALVLDLSDAAIANEVIHQGLQLEGRLHPCEIFDIKFLDRCGRCQVYGHHSNTCPNPPRCGNCGERHDTNFCTIPYTNCVLCSESHRVGSSRCRAKKARILDNQNARFPLEQNPPPDAIPSKEPDGAGSLLHSHTTQFPTTEIELVDATKDCLSHSAPIPASSTFSFE